MDNDYQYQIQKYNLVIDQLKNIPDMGAHIINILKIVDDLTLSLTNNSFNADSNLTLTKERAQQRFSWIRSGSISYVSHIAFVELDDAETYSGLTEIAFELTTIPKLLPLDFVC